LLSIAIRLFLQAKDRPLEPSGDKPSISIAKVEASEVKAAVIGSSWRREGRAAAALPWRRRLAMSGGADSRASPRLALMDWVSGPPRERRMAGRWR
jgi:hypothetical protein